MILRRSTFLALAAICHAPALAAQQGATEPASKSQAAQGGSAKAPNSAKTQDAKSGKASDGSGTGKKASAKGGQPGGAQGGQQGANAGQQGGPQAAAQTTSPWRGLRKKLAERRASDEARLSKQLRDSFDVDLVLDYGMPDNRSHLHKRFAEIVALDPDVGGPLVKMLETERNRTADRHRADNARRILANLDLRPYYPTLRELLANGSIGARLRALWLLCRAKAPGVRATLEKMLEVTPAIYLPRVIECAGIYGDKALCPKLVEFSKRPSEQQRWAAMRALMAIGEVSTLDAVRDAAIALNTESAYRLMLAFATQSSRQPGAPAAPIVRAALETLKKSGDLVADDLLDALKLLTPYRDAELGKERSATMARLRQLLEHGNPSVKFGAAKKLTDLGDKNATKQVLDGLSDFIKKHRKSPWGYYQRALANEAFGKIQPALRDVTQAIKLSVATDSQLHFFAARLEARRGSSTQVLKQLKAAKPTKDELAAFRRKVPEIEALIKKSRNLRRYFEQ